MGGIEKVYIVKESEPLFDWLQIIVPTIVAALAALVPFWLSKFNERRKEFNRLVSIEHYFWLLLGNLVTQLKDQSKLLEQTQKEIQDIDSPGVSLDKREGYNFDVINRIKVGDDLYKVLIIGKVGPDNEARFIKILNSLELAENVTAVLRSDILEFIRLINEPQDMWNQSAQEIQHILDEEPMFPPDSMPDTRRHFEFLEAARLLRLKANIEAHTAITHVQKNFHKALYELAVKYQENKYLRHVILTMTAYENMINLKNSYSERVGSYIKALNHAVAVINNEMGILKNGRVKKLTAWL